MDKVLRYRTDTEPGSSGSPVFNNDWQLVALHHAGYREDGGTAVNEGIRISAIVAHLMRRSREPALAHEVFRSILEGVTDTSPYLGFFDIYGVGDLTKLEVEVPDFRGTPDFADVGIWHIAQFNDDISDQRIIDVANVIERLSLDVLGLVEVEKGAMDRLVLRLGESGWAVAFELLDVPRSQDLAVLYDKDTTTVTRRDDITRRHGRRLNAKTPGGKSAFPRKPLFAECTVRDGNERDVKFLMILVHLKAFGDIQSRARRQLASKKLAEIIEDIRAREDLPIVLGGDFNERLDTDVLTALKASPDLLAMTADDATTDAISYVGSSYRSLIDHIIVSRDVLLGEISGDDTAIVRLDKSVRDFSRRVSDHVPLVFRMVYRDQSIDIEPKVSAKGISVPIPPRSSAVHIDFLDH
jgi:endonuclease/exonuclease/phosphatase family metal-dependent hydrolase